MTASVDPRIVKDAASIARQTMSPFCPWRTLADCPSPNAAAWRAEIQELLEQGKSPREIQLMFEGRAERDLSGIPHREIGYGSRSPSPLVSGSSYFSSFVACACTG